MRFSLIPAAALVCAISSLAIQNAAFKPHDLQAAIAEYQEVSADFEFLERPKKFPNNYSAAIKINRVSINGKNIALAARGELRFTNAVSQISTGQQASCHLQLSPARASAREAFRAKCVDDMKLFQPRPQLPLEDARAAFRKSASGITADASGLVSGLAIGDTDQISDSLKRKMKVVSLTHLTAVSGANCIIVLGFVFVIIKHTRANRWWRLVIGIVALIFYVLLVGAAPSVLRAAVMAAAVMMASVLGRKPEPLFALALAVLVLLIADPWLSIDYGFALSVAATAGILILGKPIVEKLTCYVPKTFAVAISIALAAQIMCLPVLLQLQGGLSTYSVVANVAAESLVAPITVLGILACCFAWWLPGLASMFYFMASLGTWVIAEIADYFAALPENQIAWPTGILGILASIISIVAILLWLKTDSAQLKNIGKATLVIVSAATLAFFGTHVIKQLGWPNENWQIVACDVGQGDAILVRSQNSIALIDVGRDPEPVANCLRDLEVKHIDLLILSHFDMDHVGGLSGVLESQKIENVLLSPFADQRWGATGALIQLEKLHAKINYGEVGINGSLGSARWRILNPARAAVGSEDSNDASLAVWFEFEDFNFLTMADVGERGQMRMSESSAWLSEITRKPIVLKVSHHGSADQYPELIEALQPSTALISVGASNSYGHPTERTLAILRRAGSQILRTDLSGSISLDYANGHLEYAANGVG